MKKFLSTLLVAIMMVSNLHFVFASYTLTEQDYTIIDRAESIIEARIASGGESYRTTYVNLLRKYIKKYRNKARYVALFQETINRISAPDNGIKDLFGDLSKPVVQNPPSTTNPTTNTPSQSPTIPTVNPNPPSSTSTNSVFDTNAASISSSVVSLGTKNATNLYVATITPEYSAQ